MAAATRVYHIEMAGRVSLVRAWSPAAALSHVARGSAVVRVASQDDLIEALGDGVKVESAAPEPEPQAALVVDGGTAG